MIAKHYIDSAIRIRKEYLRLSDELQNCDTEIKNIGADLMSETELLNKLKDDLDRYKTPEAAKNAIFEKLNNIDIQIKRINNVYKPINDKIEELSKQEVILYENIVRSYPDLTKEEIITELNKYISKL